MLSLVPPPGCGEGSILVHPSPAGRLQVAAILASPLSVLLVLLAFRGAGPVMTFWVRSQRRLCSPSSVDFLRVFLCPCCWQNWDFTHDLLVELGGN